MIISKAICAFVIGLTEGQKDRQSTDCGITDQRSLTCYGSQHSCGNRLQYRTVDPRSLSHKADTNADEFVTKLELDDGVSAKHREV